MLSIINKKISNWFLKDEKILTVCARPLQSNIIFYDLINDILKKNGKILYISGNSNVDYELVDFLEVSNKKYCYSREGIEKCNLQFMNAKYIYNINKEYDLIIIDEVSTYTRLTDEEYKGVYLKLRTYSKKIIFYSLTEISNTENFDIRNIEGKKVFLQPRVIQTRINLKSDIPYSLYDYILWYKDNRKNIAIYVPCSEDLENTVEYYDQKLNLGNVRVIKNSKKNKPIYRTRDKSTILVTSKIKDILDERNIDGIVVLKADDKRVDYKKILFLCGKLGKFPNGFSEVLLVCKEENYEIEKALDIIRGFNKKLWE